MKHKKRRHFWNFGA